MNLEKKSLRLTLTDMERKLLEDDDGSYRKEILTKLQTYQNSVQTHINQGLPPEEFFVYEQLKDALKQAQDVIINFK